MLSAFVNFACFASTRLAAGLGRLSLSDLRIRAMVPRMKRVYIAVLTGALVAVGCQKGDAASSESEAAKKTEQLAAKADDKKKAPPAAKPGATAKPKAAATVAPKAKGPFAESKDPLLLEPSKLKHKAPKTFSMKFETTAGDMVFKCHRDWAPHGADRLYGLAKIGFYNDVSLFRAVKGFVLQFGIHGNPTVAAKWRNARLDVDPVKETNRKGTLTYAMAGSPTTRTTQVFINLNDNKRLDSMGFAPVCEISEGQATLEKVYMDYGGRPSAQQGAIQSRGNAFLRTSYPKLDYIKTVSLVK